MKKVAGVILILTGWLAVSVGWPSASEAQPKKVQLQLAWLVSGYHTGFFVAKEKGLYAARGLDVTINRGFGSSDTLKVLAAGKADFGEISIPVTITGRGNRMALTVVAVLAGNSGTSFLSLEEKGIRKIKDVEGKRFAEAAAGSNMVMLPAFAKVAGFDINKVTIVPIDPAVKSAMLFSGQVDGVLGYRPGFDEVVILRARKEGKKPVFMRWDDYGWKVYGSGIVTNDDLLKRDPKLVADFMSATMDGYRWVIENPDQALDLITKANPEMDRAAAQFSLLFGIDALLTKAAKDYGLGYMDPDRMAFQIDVMSKLLNFPPPKAEEAYTNQFIQKKPVRVSPALEAELAKIR